MLESIITESPEEAVAYARRINNYIEARFPAAVDRLDAHVVAARPLGDDDIFTLIDEIVADNFVR